MVSTSSSFMFYRIKVAGNQDSHKNLDEFDFGPQVSMAHLYVVVVFFNMRFDLVTLDSGERSLPFGLLVFILPNFSGILLVSIPQCPIDYLRVYYSIDDSFNSPGLLMVFPSLKEFGE